MSFDVPPVNDRPFGTVLISPITFGVRNALPREVVVPEERGGQLGEHGFLGGCTEDTIRGDDGDRHDQNSLRGVSVANAGCDRGLR